MKQYIPCRIAALQDKLRERGLDAALIYDRENLIYFAGISDLEGCYIEIDPELRLQEITRVNNVVSLREAIQKRKPVLST